MGEWQTLSDLNNLQCLWLTIFVEWDFQCNNPTCFSDCFKNSTIFNKSLPPTTTSKRGAPGIHAFVAPIFIDLFLTINHSCDSRTQQYSTNLFHLLQPAREVTALGIHVFVAPIFIDLLGEVDSFATCVPMQLSYFKDHSLRFTTLIFKILVLHHFVLFDWSRPMFLPFSGALSDLQF